MPEVSSLSPLLAVGVTFVILIGGAYVAAVLNAWLAAHGAGRPYRTVWLDPMYRGVALLRKQPALTERPDLLLWLLAPAAYAAVAAAALAVVPLGPFTAIADVRTGIVMFGAAEALAIVAVFLHGWSPNSYLPLIGGYRFVALGLSYELLSMFVLIAAALPAESLQLSAIVQAQAPLWNVIKQPLGLPLWLIVTMGVTFSGPLNVADGRDLSGGTALEATGRHLLLWQMARGSMLTVFSGMGAAVLLGGWHGPLLPGWFWMLAKTLALMALTVWISRRLARVPIARTVTLLWTLGVPISFLHLLVAGIEALP